MPKTLCSRDCSDIDLTSHSTDTEHPRQENCRHADHELRQIDAILQRQKLTRDCQSETLAQFLLKCNDGRVVKLEVVLHDRQGTEIEAPE